MHGPEFLSNPIIPIILIIGAGVLLYLSIKNGNTIRSIRKINGVEVLDTSYEWIYFTGFIGFTAIGIHLLAEYNLHWYDVTPIDRFTHAISGMAITAIVLNFNLTSQRKFYYTIAIAASWIAFIGWELFEAIFVYLNPDGFIEISNWDTAVDLWIDFLGSVELQAGQIYPSAAGNYPGLKVCTSI